MPLVLCHNAWGGCRDACQIKDNSSKQKTDATSTCEACLYQKMTMRMLAMLQGADAQYISAGVC